MITPTEIEVVVTLIDTNTDSQTLVDVVQINLSAEIDVADIDNKIVSINTVTVIVTDTDDPNINDDKGNETLSTELLVVIIAATFICAVITSAYAFMDGCRECVSKYICCREIDAHETDNSDQNQTKQAHELARVQSHTAETS